MNKFSIFLPVHNGSEYIKQCINSILSQTYEHFNLEILENKSNDGTYEWLMDIVDPRIRIWPSDLFLNIEDNWNRILSLPKNEYMTIIGHDDILYPNYLETINTIIEDNPDANLYNTHFDLINEKNEIIRECFPINPIEKSEHYLALRMIFAEDSFGTGYMMRSGDYDKNGGIPLYNKLLFADDALWIRIINEGYKYTSKYKCYAYRMHTSSISHTKETSDFYSSLNEYLFFLQNLKKVNIFFKEIIDRNIENYIIHFLGNTKFAAKIMAQFYNGGKKFYTKQIILFLLVYKLKKFFR